MLPYAMPTSSTSRSHRTSGLDQLSALEKSFPRIARELSIYWKCSNIDAYIDSMLLDERGNRLGFPPDILDELMFLASIRWHLNHLCGTLIDSTSAEPFNFSGNRSTNQELANHDPKSWVLG